MFKALEYYQLSGFPDILIEFMSTGILVLRVTMHLMSKRRRKTQLIDNAMLHQKQERKIKSLDIVLRHQENLKALFKKSKSEESRETTVETFHERRTGSRCRAERFVSSSGVVSVSFRLK